MNMLNLRLASPLTLLIVLIIVLLFAFTNRAYCQFGNLDNSTLREFTEDRSEDPTELNLFLSRSTSYISFGVPVSLFVAGLATHNKNMKLNALHVGESILVSTAITLAIKSAIHRPRPFVNDPSIIPADAAGSYSFPSGHTSQAFSTATALVIAYPKWYVIAPAYIWAGSVAYSRMYLGVHFPTDIMAGAITGAGSAWLTNKANNWLHGRKKHALALH